MTYPWRMIGLMGCMAAAGGVAWAAAGADIDWAYPGKGKTAAAAGANPAALPGSSARYTPAQIADGSEAVDWRPAEHPAPPAVVAHVAPGAYACGYCHLPNGAGRPENASLAGLPADYIRRQVAAFAGGQRTGVHPEWGPVSLMIQTARTADPADVADAARYFSGLPFVSRVKVVEAAVAPAVEAQGYVYARRAGPAAPLGQRIVETPVSFERFEQRDPHAAYFAYVPVGAIARGAALAASGGPEGQPCAMCHGNAYRGSLGPPLAGRSPTGLVRQLMAYKTGARRGMEASAMAAIARPLTPGQMIDLAAFLASRRP